MENLKLRANVWIIWLSGLMLLVICFVLSWAIFHVLNTSAFKENPHEEFKSIEFPTDGVPSIEKIDLLTYLDAVGKDDLRLFVAIPLTLFRTVPAEGKIINDYSLRGNYCRISGIQSTQKRGIYPYLKNLIQIDG